MLCQDLTEAQDIEDKAAERWAITLLTHVLYCSSSSSKQQQ